MFSAVGTPTNPNDTPTDGVSRTVSPGSGVSDAGNRNESDRRVPGAPRGFANPHGCSRKARPVASIRAWHALADRLVELEAAVPGDEEAVPAPPCSPPAPS